MKDFKLDSSSKITSGFQTPDNYFDTLSSKIIQRLPEHEKPTISLNRRKKPLWYAAAAILVIALLLPIFNYYNNPIRHIDEATLESYLSYQTNVNQFYLINELDTTDLNKLNRSISLEEESIEDFLISNPNIENYISE